MDSGQNTKHLLAYISLNDFSIDDWSDWTILNATTLANKLTPEEWTQLEKVWSELDELTQIRLAEVSSEISNPDCHDSMMNMLFGMLKNGTPEVVNSSVDSMHGIVQSERMRVDKDKLKYLLERIECSGLVNEIVLPSLIKKLEM